MPYDQTVASSHSINERGYNNDQSAITVTLENEVMSNVDDDPAKKTSDLERKEEDGEKGGNKGVPEDVTKPEDAAKDENDANLGINIPRHVKGNNQDKKAVDQIKPAQHSPDGKNSKTKDGKSGQPQAPAQTENKDGSNPREEKENISGIVLTFDDNFVDQWYSFLNLNQRYGAKGTFYVCYPDQFTEEQLRKLMDLQAANNEIGYHTLNHINSVQYVQENSLENFIAAEILSGVDFLQEKGFHIQSFAYPYGVGNREIDRELLKYFKNLRYTAYLNQNKQITEVYRAYMRSPYPQITYAIGIDNVYGISLEDIYRGIDRAYENNEILMLYAHGISDSGERYVTSLDRLEQIAKYIVQKNMKFYTVSELTRLH